MRIALLLAALALLLAPGALALASVGVGAGVEVGADAEVSVEADADAGTEAGVLEADATVEGGAAVEGAVEGAVDATVEATVEAADVEVAPAVAPAVAAEVAVDAETPSVDAAVEVAPPPAPAQPAEEPEPAFEPAPHSDVIDDPSTDPDQGWAPWTPGTFDAVAEAQAALVAVPLATATAAAVAASLAPAAAGRLLSRAGRFLGFMAFLPALGLFSRVSDDEMDGQPTRAAIMAFVRHNPGASIQDVRGAIDVAWGTAVYHLRRLEDAEHLVSERYGRSRRFWARNAPESRHRGAQAVVAADTPRALLEAVAARPGSRQKELCAVVGCSAPVASKYLKRMAREGIVSVAVSGRDRLYFLADGATRVPTVAPLCLAPSLRLTETL